MTFPKRVTAACVSLLALIVVTTLLWWLRSVLPGAVNHPVFFYLLPTAVLAMVYGIGEGALFAIAAFACSAFMLYDPIYSFQVSNLALGELFWFLMTALIGVKCIAELRHHSETSRKLGAANRGGPTR
jgi:K+-sensing histidine kinase KdpD